jgi:hypothetical protein
VCVCVCGSVPDTTGSMEFHGKPVLCLSAW